MAERRRPNVSALVLLLAACGGAPSPTSPPALELPVLGAPGEDLTRWWTRFQDPQLDELLQRVFAHNQDLVAAAARVQETAALLGVVDDLLPEVNARVAAGRSQTSDKNAFPRFPGIDRRNNAHSVGLDVSWELDLWGRVRAGNRAALADLAASRADRDGLQAALSAQAAQAYFRLVAIDAKLALSTATLANRETALRIQERRRDAGTGTRLEVQQAEAELAAVAGTLPRLQQARATAERALLLVAGSTPRQLAEPELPRRRGLPPPPPIPAGLPADLLQRRPDVRLAEAQLVAADARVEEARARYFPTIRLTGSIGQESKDLGDLLTSPATAWNLVGGLTQPLLGLRRIKAQDVAATARLLRAEAGYVHTVQAAFTEIYDALDARRASAEALAAEERRIAALQQATAIAAARHAAGAGSFLEQLDAERQLLAAELGSIDTAADRLLATIDVFRALGGGWDEAAAGR